MGTLSFLFKGILLQVLLILSNSKQTLAQGSSLLNIICPNDRTVSIQVGQESANVDWAEPQVSGGTGHMTVTPSRSPGSSFELGETTVTYRVVDEAGREDTCMFIVTVNAPVIYGCPDRTVVEDNEPGLNYAYVTWLEPRIEDESTTSSLTSDHKSGDSFQIGETTVTYTLTDDGPNSETCQFIVDVMDVETPTFNTCPDPIITRVLSEAVCNVRVYWTIPTASDNDGVPRIAYSHLPGSSLFGCGVTEVNFTAADPSGNVGYCMFNVTVEVGAYENCPGNITGETSPGLSTGLVTWTPPTILDLQSEWEETASGQSSDPFFAGTTNVTYIITLVDTNGGADVCWFIVTIVDVEPPIIRCPDDIVVTSTSQEGGAIVSSWPQPFISDNVNIQRRWSNQVPGEEFPVGETVVIYGTNDTTGLTSYCNFTITVREFVLSLFTELDGYTFVDNDDAVVNASDVTECLNACIDETTFVCRSAEYTSLGECRLSENVARVVDDLQLQDGVIYFEKLGDNTPPNIWICPNDVTRRADDGQRFTIIAWLRPLVSDDGGGPVSFTSSHQSGGVFYVGVTDVVYTAIDEFLNRATCSFTVTIVDDQFPVIQDCPGLTSGYLHSENEQSVDVSWAAPSALDNSGVLINVTATHQPGAIFDKGNTVVTYTAVDPSGNEETCSFIVSIVYLQERNRFPVRIFLPNLVYSDSLADKDSAHYQMLDETLQMKVEEAFAMDPTFVGSTIINVTMSKEGGVEIELSLGFSKKTQPDSKRKEIEILFNSLKADGLLGAGVENVQVIDDDGNVITVDVCYLLPCPPGMNCTIRDDTCVSYCPNNPTYCRNGGFCVTPNGEQLVSCLCSTYMYYGTRCELEDLVNEPKTLAIIVGCVWGVILFLLLALCLPICVRRYQQSKQEHHGSDSELVKPDVFYHSDDSGDDDEGDDEHDGIAHEDTKKIPPSDPLQNGGKINPAYINDEQGITNNEHTTLDSSDGSNGSILNADSRSRSQGDGTSNLSDDSTEAIDMSIISDSNDPTLTIENEVMTSNLLDLIGVETNGGLVSTDDAQMSPEEMDSDGEVPDVRFVDPLNDTTDQQSITAVVHSSEDGNFTVRSSLGAIEEEEEEEAEGNAFDSEPSSINERRGSIADSIDGIY